jgi:hypothetical protein
MLATRRTKHSGARSTSRTFRTRAPRRRLSCLAVLRTARTDRRILDFRTSKITGLAIEDRHVGVCPATQDRCGSTTRWAILSHHWTLRYLAPKNWTRSQSWPLRGKLRRMPWERNREVENAGEHKCSCAHSTSADTDVGTAKPYPGYLPIPRKISDALDL